MRLMYQPRLANGKVVPLSVYLNLFRLCNHVYWPLEDGLPYWAYYLDRFAWLLAMIIFQFHNEAEFRYLWENINNIDIMLTGVPTYIVLVETMLRCLIVGLFKNRLKRLLKKCYAEIYVDQDIEPKGFRHVESKMQSTKVYAVLYISTLATFVFVAIFQAIRNVRMPLYKMSFTYDFTATSIYIPLTLSSIYVGVICDTMMYGDGYLFSEIVLHLNEQFLLLKRDLIVQSERLRRECDTEIVAKQLRLHIVYIIERNKKLRTFAAELQQEFSYHIFILFSISASLLCALGFKAYTKISDSYSYIFWVIAKILELITIGEVGSTIVETTNNVSSMYYECGWEEIIVRSPNTHENVQLMKLILFAMEMNHKPFVLTGFNFFRVSLEAVLKILQAAGSYFTCLIALR